MAKPRRETSALARTTLRGFTLRPNNSSRPDAAADAAGRRRRRPHRQVIAILIWSFAGRRSNRAVPGVGVVPTPLFAVLGEEVVMGPAESIRELVEPVLAAAGLECWDVVLAPGVVRVLVDRPGGVDLDTLGIISHDVSAILDTHEAGPTGRYQLEVSSPGVERTLRTPAQFRRFLGSVLSVKTAAPVDGERRFHGVLRAADDDRITLGPEDGEGAVRQLAYHDIQMAHTVLVWGPTPKPGTSGRARRVRVPMKDAAS
jgi:ribosome maturation factor RimP